MNRHERLTIYTPTSQEHKEIRISKSVIPSRVNRNLLDCYPKENDDLTYKEKIYCTSLPPQSESPPARFNQNATVPLIYEYEFRENHIETQIEIDESDGSNSNGELSTDSFVFQNEDLSDCEKEVESFFLDKFESPPHSSTPKTGLKKFTSTPLRQQIVQNYVQQQNIRP